MNYFSLLAINFVSWSGVYAASGQHALNAIICALPVEGKQLYYTCQEKGLPLYKEVLDTYAKCVGKSSVTEAVQYGCQHLGNKKVEELLRVCAHHSQPSGPLTNEEAEAINYLQTSCIQETASTYKEELDLAGVLEM